MNINASDITASQRNDQQLYIRQNKKPFTYTSYLQADQLLSCQRMVSKERGNTVDDEHVFIITHQAHELWFKQILYDLETVRSNFLYQVMDETNTLKCVKCLERITKILKLLPDQILILETMTPSDFMEFRQYLDTASGFQSFQFRLIENRLGVKHRIKYSGLHYLDIFSEVQRQELIKSEIEPSLAVLIELWLERFPALEGANFNFWDVYKAAVLRWLVDFKKSIQQIKDPSAAHSQQLEYEKLEKSFESVLDAEIHNQKIATGERRFSHRALQGALMISLYRDLPRVSQPYQILSLLMDIDSLITKWRYNHVMLVQRMIGSKYGTGGSSGYHYLRSTCGDQYKVFYDLFQLSTWLIPRIYVPQLPSSIRSMLSCSDLDHIQHEVKDLIAAGAHRNIMPFMRKTAIFVHDSDAFIELSPPNDGSEESDSRSSQSHIKFN